MKQSFFKYSKKRVGFMGIKKMPTIGVAGVTIPGALDCINKINLKSRFYFEDHEHPNIILHQPNFAPTHQAQLDGDWKIVEDRLVESISHLANSGADFAIIPANTVHKIIKGIQQRTSIPVISMLDVVAKQCQELSLKTVGIMGTSWTMKDHLYREPLLHYQIAEAIPDKLDQQIIQKAIFSELIPNGKASQETIKKLLEIVNHLKDVGCEGIVLACTELPLVLNKELCGIVTLDTTDILAEAAIKTSLSLFNNNDVQEINRKTMF